MPDFRFSPSIASIVAGITDPLNATSAPPDQDDFEGWIAQRERSLEDYLSTLSAQVATLQTQMAAQIAERRWRVIAEVNLAADGPITFTNIPQTYTHLELIAVVKHNSAGTNEFLALRINSDAATSYLEQDFSAAAAVLTGAAVARVGLGAVGFCDTNGETASRFSGHQTRLMDYAATNKHKDVLSSSIIADALGTTPNGLHSIGFTWPSAAAITTLDLFGITAATNSWKAGSRATLLAV